MLIVVVVLVPLAIAVAVTLWTLEQARLRNKRNRPDRPIGVKRKATRERAPGEVRRGRVESGSGEAPADLNAQARGSAPEEQGAADVSRETR